MYEETGCFDPNVSMADGGGGVDNGVFSPNCNQAVMGMAGSTTNSHNSFEENLKLSYHHQEDISAAAAMEMGIQQAQFLENNAHLMNQQILYAQQPNWDSGDGVHDMQDVGFAHHHQLEQDQPVQNGFSIVMSSSSSETPYPPTPDLLNLFHLPRCSVLPNSSISFANSNLPGATETPPASSVLYDPLFHLNLPPQPPIFRELLQSLPHGYTLPTTSRGSGSLFDDEREPSSGVYNDGENGILEFSRDMAMAGFGKDKEAGKTKHFATERERRLQLNDKYTALRSMVPNPTKTDRASVVGDAINYIKELLRTVQELKLLVEKKRRSNERSKRQKTGEDAAGDVESNCVGDPDQGYNTSLRSSWLQRKSKDTEVDVRIIDDEVTIKLVQRKKINCLLFVSRVLDELQLDLHHVAGGQIGDHCSFLFNTKIYEGSSVYASAIANKLIEVMDRQYAAAPAGISY
ncbi:hypothetical protein SLE2022_106520 [Rubroshorea leprosula]